eukprot:11181382-Lingulodinium_polyedra.AAC.1
MQADCHRDVDDIRDGNAKSTAAKHASLVYEGASKVVAKGLGAMRMECDTAPRFGRRPRCQGLGERAKTRRP